MRTGTLYTVGAVAASAAAIRWLLQRRHRELHDAEWTEGCREVSLGELLPRQTGEAGARGRSANRARRVVILGAGFGGIAAADRLARLLGRGSDVDVLVVDRENYHLFTPLLYQVATGGSDPSNIIFAARLIARTHGFHFLEASVEGFDLDRHLVHTNRGDIPFDRLIVGLGSVNNFLGIPGADEHTLPLKSLADALAIRNHVLDCFVAAEREPDPRARRALLTFVVVGGGATGVEFIASLSDAVAHSLLPAYPLVNRDEARLLLLEALPTILRGLPEPLMRAAGEVLRARGVELRTNTPVARIEAGRVVMKSGETLDAGTVVWAAGVKGNPRLSELADEIGRDGRVPVDASLRLATHPDVYVIGDAARYTPPGQPDARPLPPNAPVAIQQGEYAAERIAAALGVPMPALSAAPFRYRYKGEMVALGRNRALAHVGALNLRGVPGFLLWRLYYLSQLMGFKNRAGILVDWLATSLYRREVTRLPLERAVDISRGGADRARSGQRG